MADRVEQAREERDLVEAFIASRRWSDATYRRLLEVVHRLNSDISFWSKLE